ncbi:helix-turn-helix transcriptional regulator [Lactiplantibacillus plantarum]|uniref:helix-turn-helix transcriptional regulator n=1 Tax=Lactiplantibacillus plantarum TaxID=1590 RepID=UPI003C141046
MKNAIATRRKQRKLSQAELAQLTAVTRQTINAIENNKYDPSLSLAFKLAAILETTVDELFSNGEDVK